MIKKISSKAKFLAIKIKQKVSGKKHPLNVNALIKEIISKGDENNLGEDSFFVQIILSSKDVHEQDAMFDALREAHKEFDEIKYRFNIIIKCQEDDSESDYFSNIDQESRKRLIEVGWLKN